MSSLHRSAGISGGPRPEADALLSVQGLAVDFPSGSAEVQAVRGIDFTLARGECLGIVGESGSGKSVSAAAIMGLLGPEARVRGSILLDGRQMLAPGNQAFRSIRGTTVSMVFQEPSRSFDPIYNIGKTFEETLRVKNPGMSSSECRGRAERLLGEVHVPRAGERLKSFPHQFSGGMLQRIMISLALANDPQILIADEPTTALDVTIQAEIVALLKELQAGRKLSLIFISHNLSLVGQIAGRILVMYGGLVLETGSTQEVLAEPRSPYTRALLNALPSWGNHYSREQLITIQGSVPDPSRPEPGCPFAPRCPLAVDRCRDAIPPMVADQDGGLVPVSDADGMHDGAYRCVFPGVKKW
jgi:peptide/nickel transport system ATP-binding protein/peptide/nickel transport system permease protein